MSTSINYGQLMHKALRRLMADVLTDVSESGLPGEHHFYITFDPTHPGVDMDDILRERFPQEMTIVLQNWFEDLAVMSDRFTVTLSFDGVAHRIVVPFKAVKTVADPSVEFGLKFDAKKYGPDDDDPGGGVIAELPEEEPELEKEAEIVSLDQFRRH